MEVVSADIAGIAISLIFGLCAGSFATAIISRVPSGHSWIASPSGMERSACLHCKHRLGVLDLIPLFSWLLLRGRCRYCKMQIGWRYPLTESISAIMFVVTYLVWGFSVPGVVIMLATPFLLSLCVIDLEYMVLPDQLNIVLAVIGMGFVAVAAPSVTSAIIHIVTGGLLFSGLIFALGRMIGYWKKKDALGLGDVKFMAVAGLWLGPWAIMPFMIMSGVVGLIFGLVWKIITGGDQFPFGPALIATFWALLMVKGAGLYSLFQLSPF